MAHDYEKLTRSIEVQFGASITDRRARTATMEQAGYSGDDPLRGTAMIPAWLLAAEAALVFVILCWLVR